MSDQDQPSSSDNEQTRDTSSSQTERGSESGSSRDANDERIGGAGRHGGRRRHGGNSSSSRQQGGQQQQPSSSRRAETMLNMEELRELTELFTAHKLTDFKFENADIRVRISRHPESQQPATQPATSATSSMPPPASSAQAQPAAPPPATGAPSSSTGVADIPASHAEPKAEDLHIITSPIVGTFYRASSPNDDSFVKAGSHVEGDTVVCIIEAMKLMNEIQAETTGTVEKIYVENGQPVEYGQPLFGIKK